jgi:hypothetical protein
MVIERVLDGSAFLWTNHARPRERSSRKGQHRPPLPGLAAAFMAS